MLHRKEQIQDILVPNRHNCRGFLSTAIYFCPQLTLSLKEFTYKTDGPAETLAIARWISSSVLLKGSSSLPEQKIKCPEQEIQDHTKTLSIKPYQSL